MFSFCLLCALCLYFSFCGFIEPYSLSGGVTFVE